MLATALAFALALRPIQDWQAQGGINSRDFEIKHYNEGGNVVEGTEFVHLEYKVSLKQVPSDEVEEDEKAPPMRCVLECQGKKHKNHAACDTSCDKPCTKKHEQMMRGSYKPLRDNMRQAEKDSAKLAASAGMPGGPDNWSSATSNALRQIKQDAEAQHKVTMKHTTDPCGIMDGYLGRRRTDIYVKGEFRKVGYYMSRGKKTPIDEPAGSHEMLIAQTWIPEPEPVRYSKGYECHCFIPDDTTEHVQDPPVTGNVLPGRTPTFSGLGWRDRSGKLVIPDDQKLKIGTSGDGINYINIDIENKTGEDLKVEAPPGTVCVPDNPGVQIMVFLVFITIDVPADASVSYRLDLSPGESGAKTLRVRGACTEMLKNPPSEKTQFKFVRCPDDRLYNLCMKSNASRFRGPWDQARIWIYTDGATPADINKHVMPGISEDRYVDLLMDVESIAGADLSQPKYKACFDPRLLLAEGASPEGTAWLATRLSEYNKKGLLDLVKRQSAQWKAALASSDLKPETVPHFAAVAKGLIESADEECRIAGLGLLSLVPDSQRSEVAKAGALDGLSMMIASKSPAELSALFDVLAAYKPEGAKSMAGFIAEFGPNEEIRKRASALGL